MEARTGQSPSATAGRGVPDQVRAMLELRKQALNDDRKNLDYRLDLLQRERSGRRP